MAKVMIVDDGLIGDIRYKEGREEFYNDYGQDKISVLNACLTEEVKEKTGPYNLSDSASGKHEVYLSRFPIVPVHNSNFFYAYREHENESHKSQIEKIARKNFDIEKIVEEIEFVNPDFLFVDLGLPYLVEDSFASYFLERAAYASLKPTEFPPINEFYNVSKRDSILNENKTRQAECFNLYLEDLDNDIVKRWVAKAGGIALGDALIKKNIPFSFWTADFGHSEDALVAAEMLGLVSEEDVLSAIECCSASFYDSEGSMIKERIFPVSNKRGNLLFQGKGSVLEDSSVLERGVDAVRDFQVNWNL